MLRRSANRTVRAIVQSVDSASSSSSSSSISSSHRLRTAAVALNNAGPSRSSPTLQPPSRMLTTSGPRRQQLPSTSIPLDKYKHFDPQPALNSAGRVPATPYDLAPLACSAPHYPKGHLVIHPYTQPRPESTWPASIESVCPIFVELNKRTSGELNGWGVSFSEGDPRATRGKEARFPPWDPKTPKVARPEPGKDESEAEEFLLYAYEGNGKYAVLGPYSLRSLPTTPGDLSAAIARALHKAPIPSARYPKKGEESHVYVCTHGTRDCRCGVVGDELRDNLLREVRSQELRAINSPAADGAGASWSKKVRVFGISHVGGHKWAANALVYPHGDWYGNLRSSDTPLLLRSALAPSTSRHDLTDQRERLVHWPRWRGRLGIDEDKTRKIWEEWGGGTVQSAVIKPIQRRRASASAAAAAPSAEESALPSSSSSSSSSSTTTVSQAASTTASEPSKSTTVTVPFRKHDGSVVVVEAQLGENLKDVAKRGGIEEIEATCQGKCECATCHAYLAPAKTSDSSAPSPYETPSDLDSPPSEQVIPAALDEEHDMLDYAISRKATSRLTCQVVITPELAEWFQGPQRGRVQLGRY